MERRIILQQINCSRDSDTEDDSFDAVAECSTALDRSGPAEREREKEGSIRFAVSRFPVL